MLPRASVADDVAEGTVSAALREGREQEVCVQTGRHDLRQRVHTCTVDESKPSER